MPDSPSLYEILENVELLIYIGRVRSMWMEKITAKKVRKKQNKNKMNKQTRNKQT